MPIEAYTEAIEAARVEAERDFGLVLRWIYDIPGESGVPAADATLGYALDHRPEGLVGVRAGRPRGRRAAAAVPAALRAGPRGRAAQRAARRRDHRPADRLGLAHAAPGRADRPRHLAAQDPALLRTWPRPASRSRCARRPTSPPGRWPRLEEHPIRAFRDAGVTVTVNSDDPPMFGTTLNRSTRSPPSCWASTRPGVADLARAAVRASFAPEDVRARVLGEIDAYAGEQAPVSEKN